MFVLKRNTIINVNDLQIPYNSCRHVHCSFTGPIARGSDPIRPSGSRWDGRPSRLSATNGRLERLDPAGPGRAEWRSASAQSAESELAADVHAFVLSCSFMGLAGCSGPYG